MFSSLKRRRGSGPPLDVVRDIEVAGKVLPLTIRQNARATRMTLRIEPGGRALKLTVPEGLPEREVSAFLTRHQGWLMTKLARFSGESELEDGGTILVRGVAHRIERTGRLRGLTEALVIGEEAVLRVGGAEEHLRRRIADYLKKEARSELERLVAVYAGRTGSRARSLSLKDTRSRWGSCSAEGDLSFSWRIAMAPPKVIAYLAAHEVAHLQEMNHGPRFWALCESLCPETKDARHWLKRNGTMLHAIDFG
ncbi:MULTISPECIES: M48 family metallopeptidase [Sinorhizobium]|jgi:predicted metal-dependent hydrolase|uniref:M48 family peptidase n=1 Tax=Rhizobium meliloti TaxID=382 RepID=A0A2J0Z0L4_RHIML|nr:MULTISPECIES: SprT family zinc-dependent metalloprotease [Sinorhizobium]PJR14060.1 M48 family peptidase [Sinorhizobium meliloti]PND21393.1 M48 family peptidase [Ensifer sp. MMN_5]PND26602.1 M48 family peptidase [Sinorhizobium sp. M4_45]